MLEVVVITLEEGWEMDGPHCGVLNVTGWFLSDRICKWAKWDDRFSWELVEDLGPWQKHLRSLKILVILWSLNLLRWFFGIAPSKLNLICAPKGLVLGCIEVFGSILLVSLKFHPLLSHGSWGWSARLSPPTLGPGRGGPPMLWVGTGVWVIKKEKLNLICNVK